MPAAAPDAPALPAPLPLGPPGVHARLLVGDGDANWHDVYVAGSDDMAVAHCRETLAWLADRWKRVEQPTRVVRDCGVADLPGLLALEGEPLVLMAPPEDPSLDIAVRHMWEDKPPDGELLETVVRQHTRFANAAECRQMLKMHEARHEAHEREAGERAQAWLDSQRARAIERRDQACASAREGGERCKAEKSRRERSICELDVLRLTLECQNNERLIRVIEERSKAPRETTPFDARCVAWRAQPFMYTEVRRLVPPALAADTVRGLDDVLGKMSEAALREHVEKLASDDFQGRAPGTAGEEVTLAYLERVLEQAGFSGAGLGTGERQALLSLRPYRQIVPLIGARARAEARGSAGKRPITLKTSEDFVAHSLTGKPDVRVDNAEVVFVGYGVRAPEYGWDDYQGLDVRGKLLVMLVGDPPVPDAKNPSALDATMFAGRAMTYYGRWTYKFEMAGKLGAAGVLLVHDTQAAGYGWDVVRSGAEKELLALAEDRSPMAPVQGWLSSEGAQKLFTQAGLDFAALKKKAKTRDAQPVALDARLSVRVRSKLRRFTSFNLVAKLEGSHPELAKEAVLLSAHWDHFGEGSGEGDRVFNGAIDNASGVATMLELAKALAALPTRPKRSIIVLAPTAEEAGLLGARHYAQNPTLPLADTVANINMDCMNLWGRARALVSIGVGTSSLDEVLAAEAARVGRVVIPDPEPEKGYFFRSDHLELMKRGVPALHFLHPGDQYEGMSAEQSSALRARYVREDYHKVTDQVGPALRYDGALDDARLLLRVVLDVSEAKGRPRFTEGPSLLPKPVLE